MRQVILAGILVSVIILGGCGESIEHRVQRAQIALNNSKLDQALQLVNGVLAKDPGNVDARLIKSQAEMRLLRLDASRNTLDALLKDHPDDDKARRQLATWAFARMANLLQESDFGTNSQRQKEFDSALATGRAQADWIQTHDKASVEADYLRARLLLMDAERLKALLVIQQKTLPPVDANGNPQPQVAGDVAQDLKRDILSRDREARERLKTVIAGDPRHFEAASTYLSLLQADKRWNDIEGLCQTMAGQKALPAALVSQMVVSLLLMPPDVETTAHVMDLARQLQANVDPSRRNNSVWRITQARLEIKADETAKALEYLNAALKDDPRSIAGRYLKAQCLLKQNKLDAAKTLLEEMIPEVRGTPAEALVQMLYGAVQLQRKDLITASEALRRSLDLNPTDATTYQLYLRAQSERGLIDQTGSDVDAFYNRNPADPKAIRFKMQYEEVRGRRDAVAALLSKVERLNPLLDDHLTILVDGYLYLHRFDQAQRWAQELVNRQPDNLDYHLRLAQAMLMQGQDEQVRTMLGDLRKQFPKAGSVDLLLAQLYLNRQSYDKVVDLMQKMVVRDPDNVDVRLTLARGFAGLALFDDALDQLHAVLEKDPRNFQAHALAARIYQTMGQMDKAGEELAQIDPNSVSERTDPALLAQLKYRQKQYDEAADICNRALANGVADPMIRQILAAVYIQKKDFPRAETNMLALVHLQPNNGQVYANLARFYISQKMVDKGLVEVANLQSLNEPMARLARATLLASVKRYDDAIRTLVPIYGPLIQARDRRALTIADCLCQLHMLQKDPVSAQADYEPLIKAGFMASEARFRQIMLAAHNGAPAATTMAQLDKLAGTLTPDDQPLRMAMIRAFASLGNTDRALSLTDGWIAQQPDRPELVRLKGELLLAGGKATQAEDLLSQSLKKWPDDEAMWRQLAATYVADFNYPAAQQTFEKMASLSAGARISGLAALGQLYVALGLNEQATATFSRLEKESRINDPRVMLAMGQALHILGQDDMAAKRLAEVPSYAIQYAPAQVLLARVEEATGHFDDARKRLEKLISDPQTAAAASTELLRLNLRSKQAEDLIRWSDQRLAVQNLPPQVRHEWLNIRTIMADMHGDLATLKDSLDQLQRMYPDAVQVQAAEVLTLIRNRLPEAATQAFNGWPKLQESPYGPLLGVALGQPVPVPAHYGGLQSYVVALAQGDTAAARAALDRLQPARTIFAADLLDILKRPDVTSSGMKLAFRQLAVALAAEQANLSQMAADYAQATINGMPSLAPAYAILVQAMLDMEQPTDAVLNRIKTTLPDSSIALYLSVLDRATAKDYVSAVQLAQTLAQRNPENQYVRYMLTQLYDKAGQYDAAISGLRKIVAEPQNPFYAPALNDLAYLLAEHQPQHIAEAATLARKAFDLSGQAPPLMDTMGWIDHLQGDNKAALKYLSRAIGALKAVPDVHYHIGLVYRDLGYKDWARYNLAEAARGTGAIAQDAKKALDALQ